MNRKAAQNEPDPTGDGDIVVSEVLKDIIERSQMGKQKYGTYLRTNNGRDALNDLYQELLDAVHYVKQEMMERDQPIINEDELIRQARAYAGSKSKNKKPAFENFMAGAKTVLEMMNQNLPLRRGKEGDGPHDSRLKTHD